MYGKTVLGITTGSLGKNWIFYLWKKPEYCGKIFDGFFFSFLRRIVMNISKYF